MSRLLIIATAFMLSCQLTCWLELACANETSQVPEGPVLWLDAGCVVPGGLVKDASAVGTKVAIWKDISGHANNIEQDLQQRQPTIQYWQDTNRAIIRFDGNDLLTSEKFNGFTLRDQPIHVVMVFASLQDSPPMSRLIEFQPVEGNLAKPATVKQHGFWVGRREGGKLHLATHYGDEGAALSVAWDSNPHIAEVVYAGAQSWVHYLDGIRDGGGLLRDRDFHGFTKELRLAVGQHYGSTDSATFFAGDVAEILVYDRVLSGEEQNSLKRHLSAKWSLEVSIESVPLFEQDVLPILAENCHDCHGEDVKESNVDLRTVSSMLRGGESGPVISRGYPEFSDLLDQIVQGKMPPDDAEPLDWEHVATIRRWIAAGAPADEAIAQINAGQLISKENRQFWAFQLLGEHEVPQVTTVERVVNAIDAFVLARLEQKGISLAPQANRLDLLRRAYFDLTGLPPEPADAENYSADKSHETYEALIDRLLESKHFGERWGRSWLDWAGYVDVYGRDNDFSIIKPLKGRWHYRDYVIRSFNEDKAFDRFLVEQLAGDELVDWRNAESFTPEITELLTATGFLLCSDDDTDQNELNTPDIRHYVLQQTGEVVANNLFALTVQCAKCHNHKYEAITQLDYYSWLANFSPIFNPQRWVTSTEHEMPAVSSTDKKAIDKHNEQIESEIADQAKKRKELLESYRQRIFEEKLKKVTQSLRNEVKISFETSKKNRNESQKTLVDKFEEQLKIDDSEITASMNVVDQALFAEIEDQIDSLESRKKEYETIQVAVEQNPPSATFLLRRGEVTKPGVEVQPALFSILTEELKAIQADLQVKGSTSGRRLTIAKQVTDPNSVASSLVARVFVNRVWQELFGKGLVETSDNFGVSGSRPTHPELLDWLARKFVEEGWRVKPLIKLMMMSNVYRQSSIHQNAAAEQVDPANHLLWRARLRRLPSEYVRDRVLAVSGQLDRTIGGKPVPLLAQPDGKIVIDMDALPTPTSHLRRSMYVLNRRNYHLSMLTTFDQPFLTSNCTCRKPSAVVTQSLTMLNDEFVNSQASDFARRVMKAVDDSSLEAWVKQSYLISFCRQPSMKELKLCQELALRHIDRYKEKSLPLEEAQRQALEQLCHMLLNTNEFLYVQ